MSDDARVIREEHHWSARESELVAQVLRLAEELSASRAREQRLTEAGDELATGVRKLLAARGGPTAALAYSRLDGLDAAWREAVRGDAPTDVATVLAGEFCPIDGCGAEGRLHTHDRVDYDRAVQEVHVPAAAPTDGQAPADELRAADYEAGLEWFREHPFSLGELVTSLGDPSVVPLRHAATVIRHVLAAEDTDYGGSHVAAPANDTAAPDERTLYELQVPPPPPAHVTAVQPTSHSDGPWLRDGDDWVRGRQRCTWDYLMWKYNSRGRGVEPVAAARPARDTDGDT